MGLRFNFPPLFLLDKSCKLEKLLISDFERTDESGFALLLTKIPDMICGHVVPFLSVSFAGQLQMRGMRSLCLQLPAKGFTA